LYADVVTLRDKLREAIFAAMAKQLPAEDVMDQYNEFLFRKDESQVFRKNGEEWYCRVKDVSANGKLNVLLPDSALAAYTHGEVEWVWR
jgi:hypothetical protein